MPEAIPNHVINASIAEMIRDFIDEGYTRQEAIAMAKEELEKKKRAKLNNKIAYAMEDL